MADPRLTVRDACRRRMPLGGPDAQALEHALTMTERERDEARSALQTAARAVEDHAAVVEEAYREGYREGRIVYSCQRAENDGWLASKARARLTLTDPVGDDRAGWSRCPRGPHGTTRQCDWLNREGFCCRLEIGHTGRHSLTPTGDWLASEARTLTPTPEGAPDAERD